MRTASFSFVAVAALALSACCTTVECPEATLELCVDDVELSNGATFAGQDATLTGTTTETACPCARLGFIQAGRMTWISTGGHFQANEQQQARMTGDGWAVDNMAGAVSAWYPRVTESQGSTIDAWNAQAARPGSGQVPIDPPVH